MEILTTGADKRTVLALLDESEDASEFCRLLSQDFELVTAHDAKECLSVIHERFADLSAVIIDVDFAKADDYALLRHIAREDDFDTIPIIAASTHRLAEDDLRCLEEGASDFIMKPYCRELVTKRISNAIRIKSSTTFFEIESMLRELPSNIFLKDAEGRYVFSTHYWHHLETGDDPNWTIRGKTDLEIRKDRENAIKAMEADREIIRTGKGTNYVIEVNADGQQDFLELIKRPVFDDEGHVKGIIALINDVTEHELLKRELEKRARTDELTGLGNRRSFDEYVREIAQRDDFPIAVISADCDGLKAINDTFGHLVGDEYLRMSALAFKTLLPENASAFRTGGDEFTAFLPGMTRDQANDIVNEMRGKQHIFKLKEHEVSISFGTDVIESAEGDVLETLARADRAMYANKAARKRARK